jgi:hypothetical protein
MGDVFKRRETTKPSRVYENPEIVEIFHICDWLGYFERIKGYDDEVAIEFDKNCQNIQEQEYVTKVRRLVIRINETSIRRVSSLPLALPRDKEEMKEAINSNKAFFLPNKKPHEDTNGVKMEILPLPWLEASYHIIKYNTCEGRMSVVYATLHIITSA